MTVSVSHNSQPIPYYTREEMDPSFTNYTDENQELSELHQTSNSILNSVESLLPWGVDLNTQFFDDFTSLIGGDEYAHSLIESQEENPQESVNITDIQHNSDGDQSTEIFMDPPAIMMYNEPLASPDIIATHNIHENTDDQHIIQENTIEDIKSLWEDEIVLDQLSDEEPTDINNCEIISSTSLNIDEPIMTPNETISSPILASKKRSVIKKRKRFSGKPSCDILKVKLSNDDETMPTTSVATKPRKAKKPKIDAKKPKIEKLPQDIPAKIEMFQNMIVQNTKQSWFDRATNKTNAVCKAVFHDKLSSVDFASVKIQIVKCDKNLEISRRICFKKSAVFQASLKQLLKSKVIDILKVGNNVTSEYYIVHYSSRIVISVRVRNTCLISAEVANELATLCDSNLLNDVMNVLNGDSFKKNI